MAQLAKRELLLLKSTSEAVGLSQQIVELTKVIKIPTPLLIVKNQAK